MTRNRLNIVLWVLGTLVFLLIPRFFTSGYILNAFISMIMWIIFALSFDLCAGHVGAVSLGHPVFFGIGAYIAALAVPRFGLDYISSSLLSALSMGLLALIAGVAFFRIKEVSFAIGTLSALIIAQLVANNAYNLTGGPLCTKDIPRPTFAIPGLEGFTITTPAQYYYLLLPLLLLTIVIYRLLTTMRIGRAFAAVREDEVRASAMGIYPMRYKLLAFTVGGAIIGALGTFQAQYITVVCPSELALTFTLNLLIIVFVGGAGHMGGIMLGAILFTWLPRLLETAVAGGIPPAYQQVAYGLILLLVIRFLPDGLYGWLNGIINRFARSADAR